MELNLHLHPKQFQALTARPDNLGDNEVVEVLFGGAVGGGKSFTARAAGITYSHVIPGLQTFLFRRELPDLRKNHFSGSSNFLEILQPWIKSGYAKLRESPEFCIEFPSTNSKIHLCHCQHEKDVYAYQGSEIHQLILEESTQFTPFQINYLRSRVRLGGLKIPEQYQGMFPRALYPTNPGGIGHQLFKSEFVDIGEPLEFHHIDGYARIFVPSLLEDNPTLTENDPGYADRLLGSLPPEMAKAYRYGDWDIIVGSAFEKLSRQKHMIRPFTPPKHWTKFTSMDWGTAKPYAMGWYCVVEGMTLLKGDDTYPDVYLPDGAVVMYRELYGYSGQPDVGTREESIEVVGKAMAIENESQEHIDYRILDSSCWAQSDGPSTYDRMYKASKGKFNPRQAEKDRQANYQEVRLRIAGEDDTPMFYITANCHHWWRTVPSLVLDNINPEKGPDTKQEDHHYDQTAYALRSYPYVQTQQDRVDKEWAKFRSDRSKYKVDQTDPYRLKKVKKKT